MKIVKFITLSVAGLLALGSVAAYRGQIRISAAATHRKAGAVVDADGSLRVPAHYRTSYQFLGSWAIAADKGRGSKALHVVYASPGTIAAYQRTGRFPDGSVLVKEVYQTATQPMATGTVSHAEKLQGWFVMVKESKDIHPNNKLWARVGPGHGSMRATHQKPHRRITRKTVYLAIHRRELPIWFTL
jgi:hypothetical protein